MTTSLTSTVFFRLSQIVWNPKRGIPVMFPDLKSTWWTGVKSGRFPKPVKISLRCVAWRIKNVEEHLGIQSGEVYL